jgi:predicted metal-dependent hydrolase
MVVQSAGSSQERPHGRKLTVSFPLLAERPSTKQAGTLDGGETKTGDTHEELQTPSACEQGKEETMADNKIHEASWDVVKATREANQAVATTTVTVLDRNMKFAQNIFLSGIEVLEKETDDLQNLTREWGQQIHKQQEAFQQLTSGTMETYLDLVRTWFSFPQLVWGATRSAVDREPQFAQDGAQEQRQ